MELAIKNRFKKVNITEKPLQWWDYLIFGIVAFICFFSFQHGDILHTAGSSFGYLNGHFFDFYDYNAEQWGFYDSYMPSSYMMFALWNIPLKLFGIVQHPSMNVSTVAVMWYKLFPTVLYMVSGYLIYKICMEIGMGTKKSKLCTYAFYTTPIAFFSQFIFGQYDIFTLFFMLLGIYFYFKERNGLFVLFFSFSIPFKYFSLLIFLPLVLLKEKNVWKVLRSCVLVTIPYIIEVIMYLPSQIFREYVFGFGPAGYIFQAGIDTGYFKISLVVLVFGLTCAWAYFQTVNDRTEWVQWAFFLSCLSIYASFGLSMWHPQWLLMGMPFLLISAFMHRDTKIFMILDILLMGLLVVFTVNYWFDRVDQFLFSLGVFKNYMRDYNVGAKLTMREIFHIDDMDFVMSAFSGVLLISAIFKHPKFCVKDLSANIDNCMGWIRTRFLVGVSFFVIPAYICFIAAFIQPYVTIYTGYAAKDIGPMTPDIIVEQIFVPEKGRLDHIEFQVATYMRTNDSKLQVSLMDNETRDILIRETMDASTLEDNSWVTLDTDNIEVEVGREYRVIFHNIDSKPETAITLYRTNNMGLEKNCYATVNGEITDYQICMKIYENEK